MNECVPCSECYFYWCFFKELCNILGFFSNVCEGSPFCLVCVWWRGTITDTSDIAKIEKEGTH
jgi:hypothetical protein